MSLDLSFPRRPYVEAYLGGDWQNLTDDVRQRPGIKIDRGRRNEATGSTPGKCTFVLDDGPDHGNGNYSPRNPLGTWFGTLGQNNPIRVGLEVGRDTFTRTEADGWGDSEHNGPWTAATAGTTASSVSGGEGRHAVSTTSSYALQFLDFDVRDIDVSVKVTIDSVSDVTGGDLEPANIVLRGQSLASFYLVRLTVTSAETVTLRLMSGDTTTIAGPFTLPDAYTGQSWRVRAAMEQSHLVAKAWPDGSPEPLDWQVSSIRENPLGAGFVGIRSGVGGGNTNTKPVVFRYDEFELRHPRFAGEISSFSPTTSVEHNNREVAVECGGLLRRVLKYQKQLDSPVRRWLLNDSDVTPVEYWPLEELPTAGVQGANAVGGSPAQFVRGTDGSGPVGAVKWGTTDNIPPSIVAAPELTAGGQLIFEVPPESTNDTNWSVSWGQRISADAGCRIWLRTTGSSGNSGYQIIIYTNGDIEIYELTGGTLELSSSLESMRAGFDNVWHACTFTAEANGSATDIFFYIDNHGIGSTVAGQALSELRRIELTSETGTTAPSAYSHVAVCDELIDNTDYFEAFFGWGASAPESGFEGEQFLSRFVRLCTEQGIPYSYIGSLFNQDRLMGPQTPNSIGTLITECAERDTGTLYEPRTFPALAIRSVRSLYDQDSIVTIDYSAGQVAPEFAPVDDDLEPLNDATVKATYTGTEARYEKTSGANNVNDPGTEAGAVGRYDKTVSVNVNLDDQLKTMAGWLVHLGTVDEPRFPSLTIDLRGTAIEDDDAAAVLEANIDDKLTLTGLSDTLIYDDVDQLVRGYTEVFDTAFRHVITFNVSPASPYRIGFFGTAGHKFTVGNTTLNDTLTTTETDVTVFNEGDTRWSTDAGDYPFDIMINGERMTATACSGTGASQTFTVVRSVNGVVKEHAALATTFVRLADPVYFGLGG